MLRVASSGAAAVIAVLGAGCASTQASVPMVGREGEVHALAGQWAGEYSSAESGRSGSISFTLRASDDSAFGDVIMIPTGAAGPLRPWRTGNAPPPTAGASPEVLTIRFVRVEGSRVSGTLAPYADPVSGTQLFTTFSGTLNGDSIEGTYVTRLPSGEAQSGRWSVKRGS